MQTKLYKFQWIGQHVWNIVNSFGFVHKMRISQWTVYILTNRAFGINKWIQWLSKCHKTLELLEKLKTIFHMTTCLPSIKRLS